MMLFWHYFPTWSIWIFIRILGQRIYPSWRICARFSRWCPCQLLHLNACISRDISEGLSRSTFRQCMTSFWWPQSPESDLYFFQNFDQKNKILSICCISYPSYVNINPPWQFPFSCHLLDFFIARLFFPRGQESQARVFLWRASSTTTKSIEHPTRIHAT